MEIDGIENNFRMQTLCSFSYTWLCILPLLLHFTKKKSFFFNTKASFLFYLKSKIRACVVNWKSESLIKLN